MAVVRETQLPGVGVKHDFRTEDGREVGVLVHRDGRRDIVVYDADDPDTCSAQITFSRLDTRTLAELLGASQVTEAIVAVQQAIEGLTIEWLTVADDSAAVGRSIADGEYRTRTGTSIVAVVRGVTSIPAPGPEFVFDGGDVAVAVGTTEGLDALRDLIAAA
jgi:TrkA domain protein